MFQEKEYCRSCGKIFSTGDLSHRGLCAFCGKARLLEAAQQMRLHKGWVYEKWKTCYLASLTGVMRRLSAE